MRESPALVESRRFGVRRIPLLRPLGWLGRGWFDLVQCPVPGLLHGLALALFGAALIAVAGRQFWLLAGAFSGFLLVAPILATGLYQVSRTLERGERASLAVALRAWKPERRLVVFGLLLALAGTGWVVTSASLIYGFADAPVHDTVGFLLVAPILATGLYKVSRALERGERADLGVALGAWRPEGRLMVFGVLLAFAGTGWVLTSASLIYGFAGAPVNDTVDFFRVVVLNDQSHLFEIWLGLGAFLAAPVFASTVVAIPLLLDRKVGVLAAVLTSWRVVQVHPLPMALWAALLLGLTAIGMATALVGLIVVAPWLAHASWHAYRDLVDTSALAPND